VDTQFSAEATSSVAQDAILAAVQSCIPQDFGSPLNIAVDLPNHAVTLTSLSRNLNVGGFEVIPPEEGQPLKIAFGIQARANWVQVAEFEGRFFSRTATTGCGRSEARVTTSSPPS